MFGRFLKTMDFPSVRTFAFLEPLRLLDWVDSMGFDVVKFEASNGLDIGPFKIYKYMPNLFGHQICYLLKAKNK